MWEPRVSDVGGVGGEREVGEEEGERVGGDWAEESDEDVRAAQEANGVQVLQLGLGLC